jgi:hypothetical protein
MTALSRLFFRNEVSCRSTAEVIGWWEKRRLSYNIAVGAAGVFSYAAVQLILLLPPRPMPIPLAPSLVIPVVYGVIANLCYTGGWMAELWLRRAMGRQADTAGPAIFRYGFVFSIGLTLFPIAVASLAKLTLLLRAWL